MKKKSFIVFMLLAVFLCGCMASRNKPTEPSVSATHSESVIPDPETTPPQIPTEHAATTSVTENTATLWHPDENTDATVPAVPAITQSATLCGHDYQPGIYQAPDCEQAGYQTYRCRKCGDVQQQFSLPLGHSYADADCTIAKHCSRCGTTDGIALGHHYDGGFCIRCGEKDPAIRTVTIQVKDSKDAPVDGVTVQLQIADSLHSTAVSTGGKVTFTLKNHTGSYTLVLTGIPEGYKARKDRYTYRSDTGAIVLDLVPVIDPHDHSKAAYKVGSTMGDFTLTDVDGKTYTLSRLLQEKKLVILNFWYCACVPCKAEFPYFNTVYQRYGEDIELLALNHFDREDQIRQLRSEMGLSFPLATEHLGMQQGFGIQSYPLTVFIGSNGRIVYIQRDIGFQSETELDTLVRQMIGK